MSPAASGLLPSPFEDAAVAVAAAGAAAAAAAAAVVPAAVRKRGSSHVRVWMAQYRSEPAGHAERVLYAKEAALGIMVCEAHPQRMRASIDS